ncbi:MAG: hypothetical protein WBB45_11720 [Cyclobacteriaceae bacterium]
MATTGYNPAVVEKGISASLAVGRSGGKQLATSHQTFRAGQSVIIIQNGTKVDYN